MLVYSTNQVHLVVILAKSCWYHSFAQSPNPSIYLSKLVNLVPCCDTFLYLCSRICSFWWNLSECFYSGFILSEYVFSGLINQQYVDLIFTRIFLFWTFSRIFKFWYIYQKIRVIYLPEYLCSDISTRLFVFWHIYQIFVFWYIYQIICILVYLPEYLYSDIFTRILVLWYIYQNISTLIYLPERMDGLITW